MMWSNFFLQEENRRRAAAGRRRAQGQRGSGLTPEREGKVKLALLLAAVGATLAVLSVGTEFWVELNTYKPTAAPCARAGGRAGRGWRRRSDTAGVAGLEVFRHSVRALLQRVSPEPPPAPRLTYEYSWSLGCGVGAGLILLLGSGCFLLLTLPSWPWGSLCPKRGHRAT
uniref:Calcium voltage-gated channel auxiliary subunit gamma 6 n=1 Tax=Nomascus leucogenys TaxID=61853 RepID=A0A2I3G8X5_NOMLE